MNTIALTLLSLLTEGYHAPYYVWSEDPRDTNHRNNHNTTMLLEGVPCAVLTVQKKIMELEKVGEKDGIKETN